MRLKALLHRAARTARRAMQHEPATHQTDGWTDGWHTHASTAETFKVLGDSAASASRSAVETATTADGWKRVGRAAGQVAGAGATVVGGVAQGMLSSAPTTDEEEKVWCGVHDSTYHNGWREGPDGPGYYQGGEHLD